MWQSGAWLVGAWLAGSWLAGAEPAPAVDTPQASSSAGGAYYDTGKGYVRKDHGWVKATKYGIAGGKALDLAVQVRSSAFLDPGKVTLARGAPFAPQAACEVTIKKSIAIVTGYTMRAATNCNQGSDLANCAASARSARVDWLSADELVVILETMT